METISWDLELFRITHLTMGNSEQFSDWSSVCYSLAYFAHIACKYFGVRIDHPIKSASRMKMYA